MRILLAGTPPVAVASLTALAESGHELVGVITRPDRPAGRGRHMLASPVAEAAAALALPVLKPRDPGDGAFLDQLKELRPDAVATVAYGALLPEAALSIPRHGWINLHFSLLPAWRGAAPVQRAIWAGDQITGATTFQIVKELDAGPVFGQLTYQVPARATAGEVLDTLAVDGAKLLVTTLDLVETGEARPQPQSLEGVSYARKVTSDDARIDWSAPSLAVDRQVRACTPAPGAWTTFGGQRLRIGPLTVRPEPGREDAEPLPGSAPPGALIALKHAVLVRTGSGWAALGEVEPAGKTWMPADAWARGARLGAWSAETSERFGE
ncbi:MAG: methionyl-tRNA formyltransferase [Bifidobacteriaceae bacterium]|jgi:methionyl-tRNA formyltransferase|nr:methionyl-tRNA formyltransferase [Bifidobacteriaceae bacterium]